MAYDMFGKKKNNVGIDKYRAASWSRRAHTENSALLVVIFALLATSVTFSVFSIFVVNKMNVELGQMRLTVENLTQKIEDYGFLDELFLKNENIYPMEMDEDFSYDDYDANSLEENDSSAKNRTYFLDYMESSVSKKTPVESARKIRDISQQKSNQQNKNTSGRVGSESNKQKPSAKIRKSRQIDWESLESHTMTPGNPRRRYRPRNNIETLDERPNTHRRILPAIHFDGDTSKYVVGHHTNYNGDGHLRHLDPRYVDWLPNNWVQKLNMDQHFVLNDGFVKIKENGLYFIYAQIYYLDEHDTNGYRVYKNEDTLLQCTTMTHSQNRILKGNTCYTAGVEYLLEGDQISVQDLADGRYSLFEVGKSFFGLVKLGDHRTK